MCNTTVMKACQDMADTFAAASDPAIDQHPFFRWYWAQPESQKAYDDYLERTRRILHGKIERHGQ